MSFRKCKMSTFLHFPITFFLLVLNNQSMESCDIIDQFSAALFVSAVLLKYFKFHSSSAIQKMTDKHIEEFYETEFF